MIVTAIFSVPPKAERGRLSTNRLYQPDGYRIVRLGAKAASIETHIGNHTFRVTGITIYLKNSGRLEVAQHITNHESPRTTKLYDRRNDDISLDEIERITI